VHLLKVRLVLARQGHPGGPVRLIAHDQIEAVHAAVQTDGGGNAVDRLVRRENHPQWCRRCRETIDQVLRIGGRGQR